MDHFPGVSDHVARSTNSASPMPESTLIHSPSKEPESNVTPANEVLSIVIPVFDEEQSLAELHAELRGVAREFAYQLDIMFIDDGSRDGSWRVIRELAERDPQVRGIRFRRNFGKAAALSAGFKAARGNRVVTLDADLQDDPAEIPRFLAAIESGLDVVSGWKKTRHDPWHKVIPSRFFNRMVGWLTGVKLHDHNCGMKCYRREVLGEVRLYGELHRFVPVLAAARGFRVGELVIHHRARRHGKSKYGWRRLMKGFLDLLTVKFLTGFGQSPQHLLGTLGMLSLALGIAGTAYLTGYWIIYKSQGLDPRLHERPALLYSLGLLLLGVQLVSLGFLAELITSYHSREVENYSVAETVRGEDAEGPGQSGKTA
jgi:glycosyltransferase involved in cell wall biosynthesis